MHLSLNRQCDPKAKLSAIFKYQYCYTVRIEYSVRCLCIGPLILCGHWTLHVGYLLAGHVIFGFHGPPLNKILLLTVAI